MNRRTVKDMLRDPRPIAGGANVDCAGSLQVVRMRVAKLAADGAPAVGAGNLYVTSSLIRISAEPTITEGEEFEQKNGAGDVCVSFLGDDTLKRLAMELDICTPDPELIAMLTGASLVHEDGGGGDTVGFQFPAIGDSIQGGFVSIEAWTRAIVDDVQDDVYPYWRWVFPKTRWRLGTNELANAILTPRLVGRGYGNDTWGNGPANDWDNIALEDADRVLNVARDDLALPAAACSAQATPADAA